MIASDVEAQGSYERRCRSALACNASWSVALGFLKPEPCMVRFHGARHKYMAPQDSQDFRSKFDAATFSSNLFLVQCLCFFHPVQGPCISKPLHGTTRCTLRQAQSLVPALTHHNTSIRFFSCVCLFSDLLDLATCRTLSACKIDPSTDEPPNIAIT